VRYVDTAYRASHFSCGPSPSVVMSQTANPRTDGVGGTFIIVNLVALKRGEVVHYEELFDMSAAGGPTGLRSIEFCDSDAK
jgi:hypothetical protein